MKLGILLGLVIALPIFAATTYGVVASGCINPGADEAIPPIERWAAKTSLRAYLKANVPKKNNPVPVTDENLQEGAKLYLNNCATCHGFADKKRSDTALGLYKDPPLFVNEDWSKDDDNKVYWFISHGVRLTGMPAYNKTLKEDQMWKIVMFIKHMEALPAATDTLWKNAKPQEF